MAVRDEYIPGDYNALCFECGRKFKASQLKKHWQGYWVCPAHWEPRHPQDFVRSPTDTSNVPWSQPVPQDQFVLYCTPAGSSSRAGDAVAGCAVAGRHYPYPGQ